MLCRVPFAGNLHFRRRGYYFNPLPNNIGYSGFWNLIFFIDAEAGKRWNKHCIFRTMSSERGVEWLLTNPTLSSETLFARFSLRRNGVNFRKFNFRHNETRVSTPNGFYNCEKNCFKTNEPLARWAVLIFTRSFRNGLKSRDSARVARRLRPSECDVYNY